MLARLRPRVTFANVCSFLALLIALGTGSAYAANTVFSTDIVDGEVKTADIANNAVPAPRSRRPGRQPDIGADAVDGSKIFDASIAHADLAKTRSTGQRAQRVADLERPRDRIRPARPRSPTTRSTAARSPTTRCSPPTSPARLGPRERDSRTVASATSTSPATPSPARRWPATR